MACSIIVIEDEPLIAMDIEFAAQDAGCEVLGVARTIETAVQMLNDLTCDGAILDANLGGESAKPIVEYLKKKSMPYIIVSGYARDQLGFVDDDVVLVGKPFSMPYLTETIRQEIFQKMNGVWSNSE